MSAGVTPPMPDFVIKDPKLLEAHRFTESLMADLSEDARRAHELQEIDEAIATWLGADLRALEHDGRPLWNGDPSQLSVREATADEAAKWHSSYKEAVASGEVDAGDEEWAAYLVPAIDPDD
jgi:hypothetical protein